MRKIYVILAILTVFFIGCGQDSSESVETRTGIFLDDPVEGLEYTNQSGDINGTTDEGGRFIYKDGDVVIFKIGHLELGSIDSSDIPRSGEVWPKDIAKGDVSLENDIAFLLQRLGKDDSSGTIKISEEVRAHFKGDAFKNMSIRDYVGELNLKTLTEEASYSSGVDIREDISYIDALVNLKINEETFKSNNDEYNENKENEPYVLYGEDVEWSEEPQTNQSVGSDTFRYSKQKLKSVYAGYNAKIPLTPLSLNDLTQDHLLSDDAEEGENSAEEELLALIDSVKEEINSKAASSIILRIQAPFTPEGLLSEAELNTQKNNIESLKASILSELKNVAPSLQDKAEGLEGLPYIEITLGNSFELENVLKTKGIIGIEKNELQEPGLTQSNPLISAPTAWAAGADGSGVAVAVLDTGVDKNHPFLSGKVVSEACYSKAGGAGSGTSLCPGGVTSSTAAGSGRNCSAAVSGCDHGTHVAGIVAGKNATFSGVAPEASIIAIQVFTNISGSARAYDSDIIKGLQRVYALRNSFDIAAVNMSLGGGSYSSTCDGSQSSTKTAIDNLLSVGIPTVIASGNNGYTTSISSPACISTSVSVGSTGDGSGGAVSDKVSSFSNSASFLDLLAPGQWIYSSIPGTSYANFQGTSMAAPQVAGAFAAIKSKVGDAGVSNVLTSMKNFGVSVTDSRNGITKPRINLNAALNGIGSGNLRVNISPAGAVSDGAQWSIDGSTWNNSGASIELPLGSYDIYMKSIAHSQSGKSWITPLEESAQVAKDQTTTVAKAYTEGTPKPLPIFDVSANGKSDKILRNVKDNRLITFLMDGSTITSGQTLQLNNVNFTPSVSSWAWWQSGDLDGDGKSDIILRNKKDNRLYIFLMDEHDVKSYSIMKLNGADYKPSVASWVWWGMTDLNGDGKSDIILRNKNDNRLITLLMDGTDITSIQTLQLNGVDYKPSVKSWAWWSYADFDGDGNSDLILRNVYDNRLYIFLMDGHMVSSYQILKVNGADYKPSTASWAWFRVIDLNGDGKSDIILRNKKDNRLITFLMDGQSVSSVQVLRLNGKDYKPGIASWAWWANGDFNGDGKIDLTLRNVKDNRLIIFLMDGHSVSSYSVLKGTNNADYKPSIYSWTWFQSIDLNGDGKSDLALRNKNDNRLIMFQMDGTTMDSSQVVQLNGADYKPSPASWAWWR